MAKKVLLTLKDPDGVWDSLESHGIDPNELSPREENVLGKFVRYREYVAIEIDFEEGTARVVPYE